MTTLFFLHGVGGGHAAWDRQVPYFTERGYRCVAWDHPGYGGTPLVEPYDFEQVVKALMARLDEPAVLVGHSMGGMVAQEACARFPERVAADDGTIFTAQLKEFGGRGILVMPSNVSRGALAAGDGSANGGPG